MLKIAVHYLDLTHLITIYHRQDLSDEQIASDQPTHEDLGKYYGFKDGSQWYAKVIMVRPKYFRTTIGLHRRADIVIQSKIYFTNSCYCGCLQQDTSFKIRRPSQSERKQLADIFKYNKFPRVVTGRVRAMLLDKLQDECRKLNIDESFIIERLHDEATNAKNRGIERIEAVKILARLNSIETERQDQRFVTNNNFLGIQQMNIQDQRRKTVPAIAVLKATVKLLRDRDENSNVRNIIEHEDFPVLAGVNHSGQREIVEAEIVEEDASGE